MLALAKTKAAAAAAAAAARARGARVDARGDEGQMRAVVVVVVVAVDARGRRHCGNVPFARRARMMQMDTSASSKIENLRSQKRDVKAPSFYSAATATTTTKRFSATDRAKIRRARRRGQIERNRQSPRTLARQPLC